jgi:hypothetical protein
MNLEKLKQFLDSEEGQKSMELFGKKLEAEHQRYTRANEYLQKLKKPDFDALLLKEISKHDEAWRDRCWKAGCEPYPSNLMELMFRVAEEFGKTHKGILDEFDQSFGGGTCTYRGFYFNWIHGQGTVLRIFNSNREEIFTT